MSRYVVTPWRDFSEVKKIRAQLYQLDEFKANDCRQDALNQMAAWRARKQEFPLALESTSDLVAAAVQDDTGELPPMAVRMLYAAAIGRFVTGFCDTTQESFAKQSMQTRASELDLPIGLVELRHEITHRDLPSLARLRDGAKKSLNWLYNWYWTQLDTMIRQPPDEIARQRSANSSREWFQNSLNRYVTVRIGELKNKAIRAQQNSTAMENACKDLVTLCKGGVERLKLLAEILTTPSNKQSKCLIPWDIGLDTSMDGAFSIWDNLLRRLNEEYYDFLPILITHMIQVLIEPPTDSMNNEPCKKALHDWVIHILTHKKWAKHLKNSAHRLTEPAIAQCLVSVEPWAEQLAEILIKNGSKDLQKDWLPVLAAALEITDDSSPEVTLDCAKIDDAEAPPASTGWAKRRGLWPRTAIGALPSEEDYRNWVAAKKLL